ncbi:MAG: prephenate dehydrogenase [Clostridia bacterium]
MLFERVAVVGVGLIGGSFGLALKEAKACRHVVGIGRSARNLEVAKQRGAIDSVASEVPECDLVLIAAPVAQFASVFQKIRNNKALITDGGSTKRDVVSAARAALGAGVARFVPAHPIAGSEKSGAEAATPDLFKGKRVILTPLPENRKEDVEKIKGVWAACGAQVSTMGIEEHDAVLGTVSHLPHLLAYALAQDVATRENSARLFEIAGAGFRDFTRLASSSPEMWRDICLANRDLLLKDLDKFSVKLDAMRAALEKNDGASLEAMFEQARAARDKWLKSSS